MNIINPIRKMKPIDPPAITETPKKTMVAASKRKMGILIRIHFAHVCGHCLVSGLGFVTETIANVTRKMTNAENTASYSCVATPVHAIKKKRIGDVIKAMLGLIKARITKIIKINISISIY